MAENMKKVLIVKKNSSLETSLNSDKSKSKSKKISYVTWLQSFAIFSIILYHLTPIDTNSIDNALYFKFIRDFVSCYHTRLFFCISGFLFFLTYKYDYLKYFIKKLKRIVIPYISLTILAVIFKVLFFNPYSGAKFVGFVDTLLFPGHGGVYAFWFIAALFWMLIIAPFLLKIFKKERTCFMIIVLVAAYLSVIKIGIENYFGIVNSLHFIFYFLLGIIFANYKELIEKEFIKPYIVISAGFCFMLFFLLKELNYLLCGLVSLGTGIMGILFFFCLAIILTNNNKNFLFGILDGYYYQIYLIHTFINLPIKAMYQINFITYDQAVISALFASTLIPIIITKFITKFIPFLNIFIGLDYKKK